MREEIKWLLLPIGALALAFPIGGAIGNVALGISEFGIGSFSDEIIGGAIVAVLGAIATIFNGGITYGNHWEEISLYPWIIGTALVLFAIGALCICLTSPKLPQK